MSDPALIFDWVLTVVVAVCGGLLAWLLALAVGILRRILKVLVLVERLVEKVDFYISKPIGAVAEVVDQIAPLVRFFAGRRARRD